MFLAFRKLKDREAEELIKSLKLNITFHQYFSLMIYSLMQLMICYSKYRKLVNFKNHKKRSARNLCFSYSFKDFQVLSDFFIFFSDFFRFFQIFSIFQEFSIFQVISNFFIFKFFQIPSGPRYFEPLLVASD